MRVHVMALLAVTSMGCVSTSTMGLARTLNRGAVQGWVAGEGGGIITANTTASTPTGVPTGTTGTGYPMIEGGVRVGVSDHAELGARLGFSGIGLEGKFAILRSPTMDSGFNLSIAPQVGFFGLGVAGLFAGNLSAQLPVLMGIDFAGHELVFGPKLLNQLFLVGITTSSGTGTAAVDLLSAGASVGIALNVGPLRLMPEVSFVVPFFASGVVSGATGASAVGVGGFIFQAGLGVLFGSQNSYERPVEPPAPAPAPMPLPLPPAGDSPPPLPPPSAQ
ncbi:MAG: hypothetical protein QM817_31095 [Archangium sp.]